MDHTPRIITPSPLPATKNKYVISKVARFDQLDTRKNRSDQDVFPNYAAGSVFEKGSGRMSGWSKHALGKETRYTPRESVARYMALTVWQASPILISILYKQANVSLVGENTTLLRPGIAGRRGSMVTRLRPCMV